MSSLWFVRGFGAGKKGLTQLGKVRENWAEGMIDSLQWLTIGSHPALAERTWRQGSDQARDRHGGLLEDLLAKPETLSEALQE